MHKRGTRRCREMKICESMQDGFDETLNTLDSNENEDKKKNFSTVNPLKLIEFTIFPPNT